MPQGLLLLFGSPLRQQQQALQRRSKSARSGQVTLCRCPLVLG